MCGPVSHGPVASQAASCILRTLPTTLIANLAYCEVAAWRNPEPRNSGKIIYSTPTPDGTISPRGNLFTAAG